MQVSEMNPFVRYAGCTMISSVPCRTARDNRIFFVLKEKVNCRIAGEVHSMIESTVIFIPAGVPYELSAAENNSLIAVNFDFTQGGAHVTEPFATLSQEAYQQTGPMEQLAFEGGLFQAPLFVCGCISKNKIEALVEEFQQKKIYFREKTSTLLKDILLDMLRFSVSDNSRERSAADSMIAYIREHYMHPITNRDIASCVRYHEYHANRLMMKHTGTTMHKYLLNYRLERAKYYLAITELSVAEVAEQTGMGSAARFSEAFKLAYGVSPSKYRKQNFRLV